MEDLPVGAEVTLKVLRQKNRLVGSLPRFAKHRRLSITKEGKKERIWM